MVLPVVGNQTSPPFTLTIPDDPTNTAFLGTINPDGTTQPFTQNFNVPYLVYPHSNETNATVTTTITATATNGIINNIVSTATVPITEQSWNCTTPVLNNPSLAYSGWSIGPETLVSGKETLPITIGGSNFGDSATVVITDSNTNRDKWTSAPQIISGGMSSNFTLTSVTANSITFTLHESTSSFTYVSGQTTGQAAWGAINGQGGIPVNDFIGSQVVVQNNCVTSKSPFASAPQIVNTN